MQFSWARQCALGITTLAVLAGASARAAAQAFVPDKGEGAVSVFYQGGIVKRHLTMTGSSDGGRIDSQGMLTDFSIGLGRKFGLSVGLPYIGSRYVGSKPHLLRPEEVPLDPGFKSLDDGNYHPTVQDLRVEVRYGLHWAGWAVAPFVTSIVPTHDYQTLSHAAVGRGVRELQLGAYAARHLDPWLPGGFVQVGYTHGFEQKIIGIGRQRSILSFEGGYFVSTKFRVFGEGSWQVTHGGIDIKVSAGVDYLGPLFIHHDQIQRSDSLDLGAGAAWTLSDRVELVGSFTKTAWGINGHAQWGVLTIGMSTGIGRVRPAASDGAASAMACHEDGTHDDRLQKCVCLRK